MKFGRSVACAAALAAALFGAPASATPVGLELMLLVDVSGSVDASEYNLQKNGYVQAFQSAAVQNAISNIAGGIAVTYIEWSANTEQSVRVGWTLVNNASTANSFASALSGVTRAFASGTALQDAIGKSYGLFGTEVGGAANGFESLRQVIDVSGDGADNDSASYNPAGGGRNAAIAAGVDAINGLAILGETGLLAYYNSYVKSATGFVVAAATFADFSAAIQAKLITEINGAPEPSSLALVGVALLGGAGAMRRAKAKASA